MFFLDPARVLSRSQWKALSIGRERRASPFSMPSSARWLATRTRTTSVGSGDVHHP